MMATITIIGPALLCMLLLSTLAAPLGVLTLWRKSYFFAESFAHGGVLGLSAAFVLQLPLWSGTVITAASIVLGLKLVAHKDMEQSTLLMLLSAAMFALAAIWSSQNEQLQSMLTTMFIGDVLLLGLQEAWIIALATALLLLAIWRYWPDMVKLALSPQVAIAEGILSKRLDGLYVTAVAVFTAFGVQSMGVILTGSLLLIPAMAARIISVSPVQMVLLAWAVLVLSILLGFAGSVWLNFPTSPLIVGLLALCYGSGVLWQRIAKR